MDLDTEYRTALDEVREATRKFRIAQQSYRARLIGDADFLASRDAYNAASLKFDRVSERRCAQANREGC